MKKLLILFFIVPTVCFSQDVVLSKMYPWKKPSKKAGQNIFETTLLKGSTTHLEYLEMNSCAILPARKKTRLKVPKDEEYLLLQKTGVLTISIKDSIWSLSGGSIALLMPGEIFSLQNGTEDSCTFHLMKYRSKIPMDKARGNTAGASLVKDWNKIPFRQHDRGGVRSYFQRPTAMTQRMEMHVTTLNEGLKSHDPHAHLAEEIILVISNKTEMQIGDQHYKGDTGDIYFLGSNVFHGIRNDGQESCSYFAFQFE